MIMIQGNDLAHTCESTVRVVQADFMFPRCLNVNGMQAVRTGWVHYQGSLIWTIHKEVDVKITTFNHL